MTTEEALLAAIWAAPHDDLPRLVYADFLDETGDPAKAARAEFIRVQCELARMDELDDRLGQLKQREHGLLSSWQSVFRPHLPPEVKVVNYDRGFILPTLEIGVKRLVSRGPNFLTPAPLWVVALNLDLGGESLIRLLQTDKLRRATRLRFPHTHATRLPIMASG